MIQQIVTPLRGSGKYNSRSRNISSLRDYGLKIPKACQDCNYATERKINPKGMT